MNGRKDAGRLLGGALVLGVLLLQVAIQTRTAAVSAPAAPAPNSVQSWGTASITTAPSSGVHHLVAITSTPDGRGYWLVGSDGGVLTYGDAGYFGSAGALRLAAPVVGMAATPDGRGYWLVGSDGGIFTYGAAPFRGTALSGASAPAVAMTAVGSSYRVAYGSLPLSGKVVTLDPGHNGANYTDPAYIDALVWNGREEETCDTAGTETASGYTEAQFNWNVAQDAAADLQVAGATVILTRDSNSGIGPCITARAAIGNEAHSDAVVSIHADGGPVSGRGFAVLEPVADGPNDGVIGSSQVLGAAVRSAFLSGTGEPTSDYDGVNGIQPRDDLAGLNLTTVPKVFIECANMRNITDAALIMSPAWQAQAGAAISAGITRFLQPG